MTAGRRWFRTFHVGFGGPNSGARRKRPNAMRICRILPAGAGLLPWVVSGQLVFNEPFSYPDGGLVTNSAALWRSSSGVPHSLLVREGRMEVAYSWTEDVVAELPGGPYRAEPPGPTLYTSFRVKFFALPAANGTYFAHLTGENLLAHRARVWAATTTVDGSAAGPGSFYIGIGNGTPSSSVPRAPGSGQFPIPLTTNVWYTLVTRYEVASAQASVWVDPRSEADRPSTADDAIDPVDITYLAFRQASGMGGIWIDDLRLGLSFASVAGDNTAPLISPIPPQAIAAGSSTGPLAFSIADAETAPGDLVVTAESLNLQLVPHAGIELSGAADQRFITVTPAPGQQGLARIRIRVSDGVHQSSSEWVLRVGYPSISSIPDQVLTGTAATEPIPFTCSDTETPPEQLLLSVQSSDPTLLPVEGLELGGAGGDRWLRLHPSPSQAGTSVVTLTVSDGFNQATTSFTVTVGLRLGLLLDEPFLYDQFAQPHCLYGAVGSPWLSVSGIPYQARVTNGWVYLHRSHAEDLAAPIPQSPFGPELPVLLYTRFALRLSELPTPTGTYFLHFRNRETGIAFRNRVFASTAGAAPNCYRLGIANAANIPTDFPRDLCLHDTYLVVTRYNVRTGETVLWVDPVSETSPFVAAGDTPAPETVSHVALRQNSGMGALALGGLRIGAAFRDVLPDAPASPDRITVRPTPEGWVLEWSDSTLCLAEAESLPGPFLLLPAARSPWRIDLQAPARFYRLARP